MKDDNTAVINPARRAERRAQIEALVVVGLYAAIGLWASGEGCRAWMGKNWLILTLIYLVYVLANHILIAARGLAISIEKLDDRILTQTQKLSESIEGSRNRVIGLLTERWREDEYMKAREAKDVGVLP